MIKIVNFPCTWLSLIPGKELFPEHGVAMQFSNEDPMWWLPQGVSTEPGSNTDFLDQSAKASVHVPSCLPIICTSILKGFGEK